MEKINKTKNQKTDAQWRAELSPEQYRVLREKGTEAPFSGSTTTCSSRARTTAPAAAPSCSSPAAKYDSGCGWPAFSAPAADEAIDEETDATYGMVRTEVMCAACGGHLGHLFPGRAGADRPAVLHQLGGTQTGGGVVEKKATFGAGCFWGVEAAFRQIDGVTATRVGYSGGTLENPTYEDVCSHTTGHAEVVEVTYDDDEVSYEELLNVFWRKHDPTQLNRQGWDIGDNYRSVVFFHDEEQRATAEASKANEQSGHRRPIVTQIEPAQAFYEAEDYHQQYLEKRGRSSCSAALHRSA